MMKLAIDGSSHTGNYRVDCECSNSWQGQGEAAGAAAWSPALPIAECVVHMHLAHNSQQCDIRFSDRFRAWLVAYWNQANGRQRRDQATKEAAEAVRWRRRA